MVIISTHIHDPFRKLQWFRNWEMGMNIDPEDHASWTIQYQAAILKYVKNEYWAKRLRLRVNTL